MLLLSSNSFFFLVIIYLNGDGYYYNFLPIVLELLLNFFWLLVILSLKSIVLEASIEKLVTLLLDFLDFGFYSVDDLLYLVVFVFVVGDKVDWRFVISVVLDVVVANSSSLVNGLCLVFELMCSLVNLSDESRCDDLYICSSCV